MADNSKGVAIPPEIAFKPIVKREVVAENEEYQLLLLCTFDLTHSLERPYIRITDENKFVIPTYEGNVNIEFAEDGYTIDYYSYPESCKEDEEAEDSSENDTNIVFHYDADKYDEVSMHGDVAIVTKVVDGVPYNGMIDKEGQEILPVKFRLSLPYNLFGVSDETRIVFNHNGYQGVMNMRQEILVPPKYTHIQDCDMSTITAKLEEKDNSEKFLLTPNGTVIFECTADSGEIALPSNNNMLLYYRDNNRVDIYKIKYKSEYKPLVMHYSDLDSFSEVYKDKLRELWKKHQMLIKAISKLRAGGEK